MTRDDNGPPTTYDTLDSCGASVLLTADRVDMTALTAGDTTLATEVLRAPRLFCVDVRSKRIPAAVKLTLFTFDDSVAVWDAKDHVSELDTVEVCWDAVVAM